MTDAEKLRAIREQLGWTQAAMAGCLNIERSYLSQLENGSRPIQKWVIRKAEDVQSEAHRLDPSLRAGSSKVNIPDDPMDFKKYEDEVLIRLYEHIVSQRNSAPAVAQGVYMFLSESIQKELSRRLKLKV